MGGVGFGLSAGADRGDRALRRRRRPDQNARAFAKAFSEALNTPVAVMNRDGAAGAIGLAFVAGARADGYALAFTPAVSLTSQPHRVKTIKYGVESFSPCATSSTTSSRSRCWRTRRIRRSPTCWWVHARSRVR
nr:tripartite tricarboxylate transporter substrate-binding protein [Ottowia beijingensis]